MIEPLITVAQALERVLEAARTLEPEPVEIGAALGRILAEDVAAAGDVPPFACSAMDGYAVGEGAAGRLAVTGESRAGAPAGLAVGAGQAIRISTGAAVPAGATAVIRQEDVRERDGLVELLAEVAPGDNIRGAGEDMRAGAAVLRRGALLGPPELGAAVATGRSELLCTRRPRTTVLCTGDELRAPGQPLAPGEIHNSNESMLTALAERAGAAVIGSRRLADDRSATEAELVDALGRSDVVVISGGVSVGPHDHVKPALRELGVQERFWRVALQPGKPTWFGTRGGCLVFGLPGNPVSSYVTFVLFALPALGALLGREPRVLPTDRRPLAVAVPRNREREQAIRVTIERRGEQTVAVPNGPQGSHLVTSLLGADALALIAAGEGSLAAGSEVPLLPLR